MSISDNVARAIAGRAEALAKVTDLERINSLLALGWEAERQQVTHLEQQLLATELELQERIKENEQLLAARDEAIRWVNDLRASKAA